MGKTKKLEKKSKKKQKHRDRKVKKLKKKIKDDLRRTNVVEENPTQQTSTEDRDRESLNADFTVPLDLMHSKSHAPETQEEYERRQSKIRREIDPVTKRIRLIKGDSEVLEEIVSRNRHNIINKEATKSDGDFFQQQTLGSNTKY